jgi:adenylate kinase
VAQAEALDEILGRTGADDPVVVHLEVDPGLIVRRVTGRRVCKVGGEIYNIYDRPPKTPGRCDRDGGELVQRDDDREEVVRERLDAYHEYTRPVLEYYRRRNQVVEVDGSGAPEEVTRAVLAGMDRKKEKRGSEL